MRPPPYWFRLAVDLDPSLNPIGSSYEAFDQTGRIALVVRPLDGPFDRPLDVFGYVLDDVAARHGVPLTLFQ